MLLPAPDERPGFNELSRSGPVLGRCGKALFWNGFSRKMQNQ
jgi:hypothetical protein